MAMNLSYQETMDTLLLRIRAGFPLIYIESHEEARVINNLVKVVRVIREESSNKSFLRWADGQGLAELKVNKEPLPPHAVSPPYKWLELEGIPATGAGWHPAAGAQADDALLRVRSAGQGTVNPVLDNCVVAFFDVHKRISNDDCQTCSDLVRPLRMAYSDLRSYYERNVSDEGCVFKTIIIIGPSASKLSHELEGDISVIRFPLPEEDELTLTLEQMMARGSLNVPDALEKPELDDVLGEGWSSNRDEGRVRSAYQRRLIELIANAGRGLSLDQFRLGLNTIAVTDRNLCGKHIERMLDIKADAVSRMPALQYTPHTEFELGGLEELKEWTQIRQGAIVSPEIRQQYHLPAPKGALLCGVSGGGKSQMAKLMASQYKLALLRLDVGALFASYIGESEERTRKALELAEVLAPVVLWLDEVDKAFKGTGGNQGDGGVSARVFGHFLTWLAEKEDSVFVVATANDFRDLLTNFPEFGRKGRFDLIYWVDLPDESARKEIFRIYLEPLTRPDPQRERPYLQLEENDLRAIGCPPTDEDLLGQFCEFLSRQDYSANMTGAEIEAAIDEAKFQAYAQDRSDRKLDKFKPEVILNAVREAKALYDSNKDDQKALGDMRKQAQQNEWLGAPLQGRALDTQSAVQSVDSL